MNTRRLVQLRLLVGCVLVAGVVTLTPGTAVACSCAGGALVEYADNYDLVFTGRQIERDVRDDFDANGVRLVFDVDRVYVGEDVTTPVEVFTSADGASCGASFGDNADTTVLASEWNGVISTGLCDHLIEAGPGKLVAIYGDGYVPIAAPLIDEASGIALVEILVPLVVLGLLGLSAATLVRKRRR